MSLITKPTTEPFTLAEAKRQLNIEHDDDDILITRLISVVRQHIENETSRSIVRQEHRLYIDEFEEVFLPFGPVKSISQVQYIDSNGATQTLASSVYALDSKEDRLMLSYDQSWPDTRAQRSAIWIDYWAGYFNDSTSPVSILEDVPDDLRHAMLMLLSDLYMSRESQTDIALYKNVAFDMLIGKYRPYIQ